LLPACARAIDCAWPALTFAVVDTLIVDVCATLVFST